ncbi:MAG: CoA transferase [Archaeoglobaceae archaeon]|nr:CoA transferase [Archaeoglobaceae archaeon]
MSPNYFSWIKDLTDPSKIYEKPEALDGFRVLDISTGNFAALFCSSILAELGAEVIRIELPGGDISRKMTPEGIILKDTGLAYIAEGGRNKYHITLNYKSDEGLKILKMLIARSDVLIESFKPSEVIKMGLKYEDLKKINEKLIYVSYSSTGKFGLKVKDYYDYDLIDQAISTIMSVTGEAEFDPKVPNDYKVPLKIGNWMAWYVGGAWGAYATLLALFYRLHSGKGQYIDVSPAECLLRHSNYYLQYYHESRKLVPRFGPYDPAVFAYTIVRAKDGKYVFVAGYSDENWKGLTNLMERPDLFEKYPTPAHRLKIENQIILREEIENWAKNYNSDKIIEMATEYSMDKTKVGTVVTGIVYSPKDSSKLENWYERRILKWMEDPYYGKMLIQTSSFSWMSETPGRIKWICKPPGADNTYVYTKILCFDAKKLKELRDKGVI